MIQSATSPPPALSIFAIPKPFRGHIDIIQRNAINSWTRLEPRPEILLLGEEAGTAAAARDLGVRHEPGGVRNELGTPLLDDFFARRTCGRRLGDCVRQCGYHAHRRFRLRGGESARGV